MVGKPKPAADEAAQERRRIGGKLRHARFVRGLRLKDVATAVGCSESLISKIENGRASPSLNMLHKIAAAVGTNIASLFANGETNDIVFRNGERPTIASDGPRAGDGIALERLVPAGPGRLLQGALHIIQPSGQSSGAIAHVGEEVGFIVAGCVILTVDGKDYLLRQGDSFFFDSSLPHSYQNGGADVAQIVWINSPPTY